VSTDSVTLPESTRSSRERCEEPTTMIEAPVSSAISCKPAAGDEFDTRRRSRCDAGASVSCTPRTWRRRRRGRAPRTGRRRADSRAGRTGGHGSAEPRWSESASWAASARASRERSVPSTPTTSGVGLGVHDGTDSFCPAAPGSMGSPVHPRAAGAPPPLGWAGDLGRMHPRADGARLAAGRA
jgi:hypothetical protein